MSTPGLALPAEQPQTELTTTSVVPGVDKISSTDAGVKSSSKPFSVSSSFIGITISAGYILLRF
jgi:hypothetical protein